MTFITRDPHLIIKTYIMIINNNITNEHKMTEIQLLTQRKLMMEKEVMCLMDKGLQTKTLLQTNNSGTSTAKVKDELKNNSDYSALTWNKSDIYLL